MQNLVHVLLMALELRRYNKRQDKVLRKIAVEAIPATAVTSVDLDGKYHFSNQVTNADLCPNIVWWDDNNKTLTANYSLRHLGGGSSQEEN